MSWLGPRIRLILKTRNVTTGTPGTESTPPSIRFLKSSQVGEHATRLAQAIAQIGRIDKTLHLLRYLDDESMRRGTLVQFNRGEGRHGLSRIVFHGKRGELAPTLPRGPGR